MFVKIETAPEMSMERVLVDIAWHSQTIMMLPMGTHKLKVGPQNLTQLTVTVGRRGNRFIYAALVDSA